MMKRTPPPRGHRVEADMDTLPSDFVRACNLSELEAKGRLVIRGRHTPILLVHDRGRVFALDNRCPHMGFPLDRGSVDDGTRLAPAERADHSPLAGAAP